jgi:hypothetical protein
MAKTPWVAVEVLAVGVAAEAGSRSPEDQPWATSPKPRGPRRGQDEVVCAVVAVVVAFAEEAAAPPIGRECPRDQGRLASPPPH